MHVTDLRQLIASPAVRLGVFWCACAALVTLLMALLPLHEQMAYDWEHYFRGGVHMPAHYPPWTPWLVRYLTWPTLVGITVATYTVAVIRKARCAASALAAFLALPLFWTVYLGQLDGLAMLGVVGLPWLAPLTLTKPQVAGFAVLSQKKAIIITGAFVLVTVVVWGFWPAKVLDFHTGNPAHEWPLARMSIWPWGLPLFALLVWWMPRSDADWWMLAGTTVSPLLVGYHLLPVMPALARLSPPWAFAVAVTSWMPFLANWVGPWGWYLGWIPIVVLAAGLALDRRAERVVDKSNG